jgi:hypothetical protein
MHIPFYIEGSSSDPSVALLFTEDDAHSPVCLLSSQRMSSSVPSSSLGKQHFKNDFGIILTGPSFQTFDIHSTIIDADTLFYSIFIQSDIIVFKDKMLEWFVN